MEDSCVEAFKKRYSGLHPLIFHRSVERARSASDLFEILEGMPSKFPISWDDSKHMWVKDSDVIAHKQMNKIKRK
jgi:hypothetical protein